MNKRDFIGRVTDAIKENGVRKNIKIKKHTFRIIDDAGNDATFVIKEQDKQILYTHEDVGTIVEACLAVIEDAIKHGEEINIQGFGALGVRKRAARRTKEPMTNTWVDVEERYVPKFRYGNILRMAARVYEMSLSDRSYPEPASDPVYEEDEAE